MLELLGCMRITQMQPCVINLVSIELLLPILLSNSNSRLYHALRGNFIMSVFFLNLPVFQALLPSG
jgi:hypothetical protein